jgi:hypothetical protein
MRNFHAEFFIVIVVQLILSKETGQQFVNLFQKAHFYELKIISSKQLHHTPFFYYINGDGRCLIEQENSTIDPLSVDKLFDLKTQVLIYSNFEHTLSFLVQLTFYLPSFSGILKRFMNK